MRKVVRAVLTSPRRWKSRAVALCMAVLLGTPLVALAAEGSSSQEGSAAGATAAQAASPQTSSPAGGEIVTFVLNEGSYDYDLAQQVVSGLNGQRGNAKALAVDANLQKAAMQRAAEYSLWLSPTRPSGKNVDALLEASRGGAVAQSAPDTPEEGESPNDSAQDEPNEPALGVVVALANGDKLAPSAVVDSVVSSQAQELANAAYTSVGVGCWYQGDHRFYAVLLSGGAANGSQARSSGVEEVTPAVEVDLSGATSKVLQGRLKVNGYETTLDLPKGGTRAVSFGWVTAPATVEALASAKNLPTIAIDGSSFTWTSSKPEVASVSDEGIVTMLASSATNAGAQSSVTATLKGSDRALSMTVTGSVPLYRLYNPYTHEHFYTTDSNEYNNLGAAGWNQEGLYWESPWSPASLVSATPVYRLYNQYSGDHHYTASKAEYDELAAAGWSQEGVKFYSANASSGLPIYRLFNPYEQTATHLYTPDLNEYNQSGAAGWSQEGAALYGVADTAQSAS